MAAFLIPALVNYIRNQAVNGFVNSTSPDIQQAISLINTLQNPVGAVKSAATNEAKNALIENVPLAASTNSAIQDAKQNVTDTLSDTVSPVTNFISDQLQAYTSPNGLSADAGGGGSSNDLTNQEYSYGGLTHLLRIMHNAKS